MTSYSGLWNNEYGENYSMLEYNMRVGNNHTALARVFAQRSYSRGALREVLRQLIGNNLGMRARLEHKRVAAERDLEKNVLGGKRDIETFAEVDRTTTRSDIDKFDGALSLSASPSYVRDASGNGGGGKLGW